MKVVETVFVGGDCWRGVDQEAWGPCTDCNASDTHINDEFGGFDTLIFGWVPDKDPVHKHTLLGGDEVLCQNSFDKMCEEAVEQGKPIEHHDGWYLGVHTPAAAVEQAI